MTETKVIIESLATLAQRKNCDACGNTGVVGWDDNCPDCNQLGEPCHCNIPCPTCADLRRVAEMKWHKVAYDHQSGYCKVCGTIERFEAASGQHEYFNNPTLTIPEVRSYMEVVGVWKDCWIYMKEQCWDDYGNFIFYRFVDLLTSPAFFAEAARFLKGEVEG